MPLRRVLLAVAIAACAAPAKADDAAQRAVATALHRTIASCWVVPADLPPHVGTVRVRFSLTPSGDLAGSPAIEGPLGGDPATRAFAASAIRAVVRCTPFADLAQAGPYDLWKTVVVTFRRPQP